MSNESIRCFMEMALQFMEYSNFMRHRCHRPKESVIENPAGWWRHAGSSVVHEIGRVCSMRRYIPHVSERRSVRQRYDALYRKYHRLKKWSWLMVPFFGTQKSVLSALGALEGQLSTVEVAEFRWWSWTQSQKRSCKAFPYDDVKKKLIEIYNVLSADSVSEAIEQCNTDVKIACPKVTL